MDHDEEQQMELEALAAILDDNLQQYTGPTPGDWVADRIVHKVKLQPDDEEGGQDLSCDFLFQHTPEYPESAPNVKVSNTRGLTNADVAALTEALVAAAEENVGMASIFAIMQAGKEWLEEKAGLGEVQDPAVLKKQQEEEQERARQAARAHGTPVTVESYNTWLAKFEAELEAADKAQAADVPAVEVGNRKTGKAWFLEGNKVEDVAEEELELLDAEDEDDDEEADEDFMEEDLDLDDDDDDIDEEEFLDQFLAARK